MSLDLCRSSRTRDRCVPSVRIQTVFTVPGDVPLFSHGNMGRNSLRGPGIDNWDISILKDFKFTETKSLEFQANFFNAFNHVQFFGRSSSEGASGFSSNFGQVTSDTTTSTTTAYYRGPRLIQFAVKVYF